MELLSILSLSLAALSLLAILFHLSRHGQPMEIMNVVWPLTALWAGVLAVWAYFSFGKSSGSTEMNMKMPDGMKMESGMKMVPDTTMESGMKMEGGQMHGSRPEWQKIALSTFHCGAGCTLADLIGETLGAGLLAAAGATGIAWQWTLDYGLALLIGAFFQFAAIRPMSAGQSSGSLFIRALKIDFLSLTGWQTGMYLFSYLVFFVWHSEPFARTSFEFWFVMQLAMCAGFCFSYPVNWLLIKKGVKPAM